MHNAHLIIVKAANKGDAEDYAASYLNDFGDADNYWFITEVYDKGTGFEEPLKFAKDLVSEAAEQHYKDNILKYAKNLDNENKETTNPDADWDLLSLSIDAGKLYNIRSAKDNRTCGEVEHLRDFFGWHFDEVGITNMVFDGQEGDIFAVMIDMHS